MRPLVGGGQTLHLFAGYGGKKKGAITASPPTRPSNRSCLVTPRPGKKNHNDSDDRADTLGEVRLVRTAARGRATGNDG